MKLILVTFMANQWVIKIDFEEIKKKKKIPQIHGKFRAKNNPMKFHFAVFMGHEMIFMGFSHEIHGIFIKLQFIVNLLIVTFSALPVSLALL